MASTRRRHYTRTGARDGGSHEARPPRRRRATGADPVADPTLSVYHVVVRGLMAARRN